MLGEESGNTVRPVVFLGDTRGDVASGISACDAPTRASSETSAQTGAKHVLHACFVAETPASGMSPTPLHCPAASWWWSPAHDTGRTGGGSSSGSGSRS